jgi:hypothetical protein
MKFKGVTLRKETVKVQVQIPGTGYSFDLCFTRGEKEGLSFHTATAWGSATLSGLKPSDFRLLAEQLLAMAVEAEASGS